MRERKRERERKKEKECVCVWKRWRKIIIRRDNYASCTLPCFSQQTRQIIVENVSCNIGVRVRLEFRIDNAYILKTRLTMRWELK